MASLTNGDQMTTDPSVENLITTTSTTTSTTNTTADKTKIKVYTCRKCRCLLYQEDDLMIHVPHKHTFSYKKKKKDAKSVALAKLNTPLSQQSSEEDKECAVYFLHSPKKWMSEIEGKIHCPKCTTRLGSFSWSGSQCSCGSWITPSISFPRSKVDEKYRTENSLKVMQQLLSTLTVSDESLQVEEDVAAAVTAVAAVTEEEKVSVQSVVDESTGKVRVEKTKSSSTSTLTSILSTQTEFDKSKINELKEMGFEVPLIKIALRKNNHKVQDAMIWLFSPEAMDFVPYPED
jgi:dual specificity phosphatase 12